MILDDFLTRNVRNHSQKECIYCEPCDLHLNYGDINQRVNRIINFLRSEGIQKGDRIGVFSANCHMYPELLMVAARAGLILVGIDHRLALKEVDYIIEDAETKIVFIGEGFDLDKSEVVGKEKTKTKKVEFSNYMQITSDHSDSRTDMDVTEDDMVTMMYTSGTTGKPKGVMYTQKNLISSIINIDSVLDVCESDKTLHTSPFSHIAPIWPFLLHCYYGGSNYITTDSTPSHILGIIEREKITTWNTVPIIISRVVDELDNNRFDVSSLKWISYGASPIPLPVLRKALTIFGNILNQVYGATETYVITLLSAADHKLEGSDEEVNRLISCGRELINTETIVVNEDGREVRPGETGEVITRGEHVSSGYWNRDDETTAAMREGGWFYTGDLATVDNDRYVYITGRRKDLIISGGENISPKEVENVIHGHPSVKEACVVGLPHQQWGDAATAFIVLRPKAQAKEEELLDYCQDQLARFKCPKKVIFVDEIPMTTSGKALKRVLRDAYKETFAE